MDDAERLGPSDISAYVSLDMPGDVIVLDGNFTVDDLRKIIAAEEKEQQNG